MISPNWRHCLRCPLADIRLAGPDIIEVPTVYDIEGNELTDFSKVILHILLPSFDVEQHASNSYKGFEESSNYVILQETLETLKLKGSEIDPATISVGFASGCRPVKFNQPSRVSKISPTWANACRPRWHRELIEIDPELVLVCGSNTLASIGGNLKYRYTKGEIVQIHVVRKSSKFWYPGFVTSDPETVVRVTSDKGFDTSEWDGGPVKSVQKNPYLDWLWHFKVCYALADFVSKGNKPKQRSQWRKITKQYSKHFTKITPIRELVRQIDADMKVSKSDRDKAFKAWESK